jgi:hypothetical protein
MGEDLPSDSLQVAQISEVCGPQRISVLFPSEPLGVGVGIEQLVRQSRELLRAAGCRRRDRCSGVTHLQFPFVLIGSE